MTSKPASSRLTLGELIRVLRQEVKPISLIVTIAVFLSVVLALVVPPTYRSEAVIAPTPDDGSAAALGGLASQFGSIASLAGISLSKGPTWDEAVATLKSRHLIEALVQKDNLLPILFAKRWNRATSSWLPDSSRVPTMGDAVLLFQRRILQVREDMKTGLVTIRTEWTDPNLAAVWANDFVAIADAELRAKSIANASAALDALSLEFKQTEGVELRAAIAHLMEAQLKSKLVAGIRKEYVFRVIDAAEPSDRDKRVFPTRKAMVLAGALFGLFISLAWVVIRRSWT